MKRIYRIPKGETILVKFDQSIRFGGLLERNQFQEWPVEKEVVYSKDDVCMYPITYTDQPRCFVPNLLEARLDWMHDYFGFMIPKNTRGVEFILVHFSRVELVK